VSAATPTSGSDSPTDVDRETLMRYVDGELTPDERRRVDDALAGSTELQRELAIFRSLHEDLSGIRLQEGDQRRSVWDRVHRRLSRPFGWILLVIGALAWVAHVSWVYMTSPHPAWEKGATSAIVIGVLLLLASVIHDRYREWQTDPYRDIQR